MKVIIEGEVIDKEERNYNDKTYYSVKVYCDGRLENISVPFSMYQSLSKGEVIAFEPSIFCRGSYSLYIKEWL